MAKKGIDSGPAVEKPVLEVRLPVNMKTLQRLIGGTFRDIPKPWLVLSLAPNKTDILLVTMKTPREQRAAH